MLQNDDIICASLFITEIWFSSLSLIFPIFYIHLSIYLSNYSFIFLFIYLFMNWYSYVVICIILCNSCSGQSYDVHLSLFVSPSSSLSSLSSLYVIITISFYIHEVTTIFCKINTSSNVIVEISMWWVTEKRWWRRKIIHTHKHRKFELMFSRRLEFTSRRPREIVKNFPTSPALLNHPPHWYFYYYNITTITLTLLVSVITITFVYWR